MKKGQSVLRLDGSPAPHMAEDMRFTCDGLGEVYGSIVFSKANVSNLSSAFVQ